MAGSPIKATAPLTADGIFQDASVAANIQTRIRVKALYVNLTTAATGTASGLELRQGTSTATIIYSTSLPVRADTGYVYMDFPEDGILCEAGPLYCKFTGTNTAMSVVVFYG